MPLPKAGQNTQCGNTAVSSNPASKVIDRLIPNAIPASKPVPTRVWSSKGSSASTSAGLTVPASASNVAKKTCL